MKWFWRKDRPEDTRPPTTDSRDLERARLAREAAERKLQEARTAAEEVRAVVIRSRQIRSENQFSARLTEAFGSRPQTNG